MRSVMIAGAIAAAALMACADEGPTDETPEGALSLFLASVNPAERTFDRERAYKLLAPENQQELSKRAAKASKVDGRSFEPSEMLVIERFVQRWPIKNMESEIDGDRAKVTAHGDKASQEAVVDLKRVDGRWRIVLPMD